MPDKERASSLLFQAERKLCSIHEHVEKIGIKNENADDYIEYSYDILMCLVRAKMFSEGYHSSGHGAHEAEVAYARLIGLNEQEVAFLDGIRYFRNGILYYGKSVDEEYAKKVIQFLEKMYQTLKK
ncbi:MAG: hypothetical protein Q7R76_06145 [Candidatus Woesearchaeota archaeon]|nr:hypothetical protein [Candidatus Woesearchaeota archaeon]